MIDQVRRFGEGRDDYQESSYGEHWAAIYDEIYTVVEDYTIDLLLGYAGAGGSALELAVGTGRLALPLSERGVEVTGVDISQEMLDIMSGKAGGEAIRVVVGDIVDFSLGRRFPLVYLPFNTLFALLTQARQVQCFANVSRHLDPGGRFVLDCFVPDMKRYDAHNTRIGVSSIASSQEHAYELSIHHPLEQKVVSHHVRHRADGSTLVLPVSVRYAWPSEMDLMAHLAGLELEDRWGWYDRRPFTEASGQHVSVYRKPG